MRLFPACAFALSLLASGCTASAIINGSGGLDAPAADDDDAVGDDDDAVGDDDDAGPEPNPFEGTHDFVAYLTADFGRGGDELLCQGDIVFEIDAEGALTGEGECTLEWGGGGGRNGYIFQATGTVTEDGDVDGTMAVAFTRQPDEWDESPLSGSVAGDVDVNWEGEIDFGWGDAWPYSGKVTQ